MDTSDASEVTKMNSKDIQLMDKNNPELNPFSVKFGASNGDQETTASASPNKEDPEKSPKQNGQFVPDDYTKYTPIKALTVNTNDWIIKARVTKKYDRKTWNNARGKGYLMNLDLIDAFGSQIQATFFKDAVDKFEPKLKQNTVYTFSGGQVKLANQRFSSIKNDFSLTFDTYASILECNDDENIQCQAFNFLNIAELQECVGQRTIDFIGVVHSCGPVREKTLRSGLTKEQRNVTLADESGLAITLCIWGDFANKFDLGYDEHPVVAVKRVSVSDFAGKSLNCNEDSQVIVNPPHRRTRELSNWYKFLPDPSSSIRTISQQRQGVQGGEDGFDPEPGQNYKNKSLLAEIVE